MTMNLLREGLPERPARIAALPVDKRGYPVPRFVALVNGEPDHRVIDPPYLVHALRFGKCWICGEPLGAFKTFLVGPMAAMNRISAEPPMHRECAHYAASACPFLSKPQMRRREAGMPEEKHAPAGVQLLHNPGATCAWTTKTLTVERRGDGVLFALGEPTALEWFAEGRRATREEIMDAIVAGLPKVKEVAERDGPAACLQLGRRTGELVKLLDVFPP